MLLTELYKCEPEYDEFFNKVEESTSHVYDVYESFIKSVASVPIWEARNIETIINAYKKNPQAIEGICKKILR